MLHVDRDPFAIAVAFQIRGDLEFLRELPSPRRSASFDGNNFGAVFREQTAQRRPHDAGRKTYDANSLE